MRELESIFTPDQLRYNEPMSRHTTMRVGGPADVMAFPVSADQLVAALELCPGALVLGNGSNLIVRDGGIRGVVLSTRRMDLVTVEGETLTAEAGALMPAASQAALEAGLTGLEFASGIPGTIGGGCAMNAGAYGEELGGVLARARVLMGGEVCWLDRAELDMGYRDTRILRERGIVLAAQFALNSADPAAIRAKMDDLNQRRKDKQPLHLPSSGSTFKRPEGHFAGALIEGAGLKGYGIGGAQVSDKHAGFVVNAGGATARDVLALISEVQTRVYDLYGVNLECEVRVVGEE